MKLTKEDIKKYGTEEEKKILEDREFDRISKMGDLEVYFESLFYKISHKFGIGSDWNDFKKGKKDFLTVLRSVYKKGYNEGYKDGDTAQPRPVRYSAHDPKKDWPVGNKI